MSESKVFRYDIDTIEGRVIAILRRVPDTRNNDLLLQWLFLTEHYGLKLPPLDTQHIKDGGIMETISRCRRKIQNDEPRMFLPTSPSVRRKRRIKEEAFREWAVREKKLVYV